MIHLFYLWWDTMHVPHEHHEMTCCRCILTMVSTVFAVAFFGWLVGRLAGYARATEQVADQGANDTPLYSRFFYKKDDAVQYWQAMGPERWREERFLICDFFYPLVYGPLLVFGFLCIRKQCDSAFPLAFSLIPVCITAGADVFENWIHLCQLRLYDPKLDGSTEPNPGGVSAPWIRFSGFLTVIKTLTFVVSVAMLAIVYLLAQFNFVMKTALDVGLVVFVMLAVAYLRALYRK